LTTDDVEWIEAEQNYVRVHAGHAAHLVHVPMNTIETSRDPERFMRIHRSYIVNLQYIRQVWTLALRQFVLELASGERLQSGRTGRRFGQCFRIHSKNLLRWGATLPDQFENLDVLTPFGAIYRYEDYDAVVSLDRHAARESLRELRAWVETRLRERTGR
jgi:LytTr DNA-binding domain